MLDQVRAETNDNEESEDSDDDRPVDDGVVVDLLEKPVMECNLCITDHNRKTTILLLTKLTTTDIQKMQ